jgi:hypothetical protein
MNLIIIFRFGTTLAFPFIVDNAHENFLMNFCTDWIFGFNGGQMNI